MKVYDLFEIALDEVSVTSSWIADLDYDSAAKSVEMTLNNGRTYTVYGIPPILYKKWIKFWSKGRFWHKYIRGNYTVL